MNVDKVGTDLNQANQVKEQLSEASWEKASVNEPKIYNAELNNPETTDIGLNADNVTENNLQATNSKAEIMPEGTSSEQWLIQDSEMKSPLEDINVRTDKPELARSQAELPMHELEMAMPATGERSAAISSQIVHKAKNLRSELPWPPLFLLWLGYISFGILLAFQDSGWFAWLLAWTGAVGGIVNQALSLYAPIVGVIAIILSSPNGAIGTIVAVATTLMAVGGLWMMGGDRRIAFRDGFWIGGICSILFLIIAWLLEGHIENWFLILVLLVGVTAAGFGSTAWTHMSLKGFSKQQTIQTITGITGFGLLIGCLLEKLFK